MEIQKELLSQISNCEKLNDAAFKSFLTTVFKILLKQDTEDTLLSLFLVCLLFRLITPFFFLLLLLCGCNGELGAQSGAATASRLPCAQVDHHPDARLPAGARIVGKVSLLSKEHPGA